jgi:hypothetical protein
MKSIRFSICLILVFCLLLQGCVSFQEKIDAAYVYSEDSGVAFVYGALLMRPSPMAHGLGAGLILENVTTEKEVALKFDASYQLTLAALEPGDYLIKRVAFTDSVDKLKGKTGEFNVKFSLKAGEAAYFGDVAASADEDWMSQLWRLDAVLDNYRGTTEKLEKKFPWIQKMPKINVAKKWTIKRN